MRRLIVLAALAFATLALGACGGGDKDADPRPAPPDVAANFTPPLDARGGDPQWGLTIRGQQLTLDRPNQPNLVVAAANPVVEPHQATWTATLPNGQSIKVVLYGSACTDDASGARYPLSAEVQLPDSAPLSGCAGPPANAAAPPPAKAVVKR